MDTREATQRYRLNQWTQIVRECRSSGQTVAAWCEEHNINDKTYYYWLKRVRIAACEVLPSLCDDSNTIVPVNIPVSKSGSGSATQKSSSDIVVHFDTVTMQINNNASAALIENTLRALRNVR